MLVTFQTKAYANITMFGDVAKKLLRLMGHSGTVPSALGAEDVPVALSRLRAAVEEARAAEPEPADVPDESEGRPIGLAQRAYPLIELLEAAAASGDSVSWR
jgi:hypothetical protein